MRPVALVRHLRDEKQRTTTTHAFEEMDEFEVLREKTEERPGYRPDRGASNFSTIAADVAWSEVISKTWWQDEETDEFEVPRPRKISSKFNATATDARGSQGIGMVELHDEHLSPLILEMPACEQPVFTLSLAQVTQDRPAPSGDASEPCWDHGADDAADALQACGDRSAAAAAAVFEPATAFALAPHDAAASASPVVATTEGLAATSTRQPTKPSSDCPSARPRRPVQYRSPS